MTARDEGRLSRRELLAGVSAWTGGLAAIAAAQDAFAGPSPAGAEEAPFQLRNLNQIGIVVKDIEASAKECAGLLGAPVPRVIVTDPVEKARTRFRGAPTPARAKLAFFQFGSMAIELIEPVGEPSTWREFADRHGEGVHHVAFRVENMDEVLAHLAKGGFVTIQTGDFGTGRYAYVDTTKGLKTMIELLEIY